MTFYLMSLWLDLKGFKELSIQLLSKMPPLNLESHRIRDVFGNLYFNEMLEAYSLERDYLKAITFGKLFLKKEFEGYNYRDTAIALTSQLEQRTTDFKSFHLPDTSTWQALKKTLERKEQLHFLLDRLHLLNCIQFGQPSGVNYEDSQSSRAIAESTGNSWPNTESLVINPFNEILNMKPTVSEIIDFLPYLMDTSYIPTYSYWRDFHSGRTVHKFNGLIATLIYQITHKELVDIKAFNALSKVQKEAKIKEVKQWCEAHSELLEEELVIEIMRETTDWKEFHRALDVAVEYHYEGLIEILQTRFKDFGNDGWPSEKGIIAKAMFELGSTEHVEILKSWFDESQDPWVTLWTSLFLLKHDNNSYEIAFDSLRLLLDEKCDGRSYYPYAMETLLELETPESLELAEGILKKHHFIDVFSWGYYRKYIKMLLLAKSEKAYHFLMQGLRDVNVNDKVTAWNMYGDVMDIEVLMCDDYIEVVDHWRKIETAYEPTWDINRRQAYSKELSHWLSRQFKLIKKGKATEIIREKTVNAEPVRFIDAPRN